jgi:hypothetical protein
MSTITKTFYKNGVLTSPDSVTLSDVTGTYGVKDQDDNIVVADGTAMTEVSAGVWTYEFTDTELDLIYTAALEIVEGEQTIRFTDEFVGPQTPSTGVYAQREDLENMFGPDNIDKWADIGEPAGETAGERIIRIANRIERSIAVAEKMIDDRLEGNSLYTVPLVNTSTDYQNSGGSDADPDASDYPQTIVNLCSTLAGVWLYENRGIVDFDPKTGVRVHRLIYNKEEAEKTIQDLITRRIRVECETTVPNAPFWIEN